MTSKGAKRFASWVRSGSVTATESLVSLKSSRAATLTLKNSGNFFLLIPLEQLPDVTLLKTVFERKREERVIPSKLADVNAVYLQTGYKVIWSIREGKEKDAFNVYLKKKKVYSVILHFEITSSMLYMEMKVSETIRAVHCFNESFS